MSRHQLIDPENRGRIEAWQALYKKLNEGAEMRARASARRVSKRYRLYDKRLFANASQLLYPATEQEVRSLQHTRSPLSGGKVIRALERDFYTCTCCGKMQIWILDDRKEMSNRHYKEYGFSYYSRTNIVLDVHHIVPIPFGDDNPDNLAVLCRECHRAITIVLCSYQASVFDEFGSVYVDLETRNKIDRIYDGTDNSFSIYQEVVPL